MFFFFVIGCCTLLTIFGRVPIVPLYGQIQRITPEGLKKTDCGQSRYRGSSINQPRIAYDMGHIAGAINLPWTCRKSMEEDNLAGSSKPTAHPS